MMDITLNNQMSSDNRTFNNTETFAGNQLEDNVQSIPWGVVPVVLDFGHVIAPTYFKIISTKKINITMWTLTINNVNYFEMRWEIPTVTVVNTELVDASDLRFLVANETP